MYNKNRITNTPVPIMDEPSVFVSDILPAVNGGASRTADSS